MGKEKKGNFVEMRAIVFSLMIFALVLIGGMVIYTMGSDPNVYRPQIQSYLKEKYDLEVEIGNLSIDWGLDLSLEIKHLVIKSASHGGLLFKSNRAHLGLNARQVLKRQFLMESLEVDKPEIYLSKLAGGSWNWPFDKLVPEEDEEASVFKEERRGSGEKVGGGGASESFWEIFLSQIRFNQAQVYYSDFTDARFPIQVRLEDVSGVMQQESHLAPLSFQASGQLAFGTLAQIQFIGLYEPSKDELKFDLIYGQDEIQLKGVVAPLNNNPYFTGSVDVHQLNLDEITPNIYKHNAYLTGILTAHMEGTIGGMHPQQIKQSLVMRGFFDLREGALKNINFIRETFQNLTPIPALTQILLGQLPPDFSEIMKGEDTEFDALSAKFQVRGGVFSAEEMALKHADYLLSASGSYHLLTTAVLFDIRLVLLDELTGFLIKAIRELEGMRNEQGRIAIPFKFEGPHIERAQVKPDLSFVTQGILQSPAGDFVQKGINQISKFLGELE